MENKPIRTGNDFLNLTMAIMRGVPYLQLLQQGFVKEDILACKKSILYIQSCEKNKLGRMEAQKND